MEVTDALSVWDAVIRSHVQLCTCSHVGGPSLGGLSGGPFAPAARPRRQCGPGRDVGSIVIGDVALQGYVPLIVNDGVALAVREYVQLGPGDGVALTANGDVTPTVREYVQINMDRAICQLPRRAAGNRQRPAPSTW